MIPQGRGYGYGYGESTQVQQQQQQQPPLWGLAAELSGGGAPPAPQHGPMQQGSNANTTYYGVDQQRQRMGMSMGQGGSGGGQPLSSTLGRGGSGNGIGAVSSGVPGIGEFDPSTTGRGYGAANAGRMGAMQAMQEEAAAVQAAARRAQQQEQQQGANAWHLNAAGGGTISGPPGPSRRPPVSYTSAAPDGRPGNGGSDPPPYGLVLELTSQPGQAPTPAGGPQYSQPQGGYSNPLYQGEGPLGHAPAPVRPRRGGGSGYLAVGPSAAAGVPQRGGGAGGYGSGYKRRSDTQLSDGGAWAGAASADAAQQQQHAAGGGGGYPHMQTQQQTWVQDQWVVWSGPPAGGQHSEQAQWQGGPAGPGVGVHPTDVAGGYQPPRQQLQQLPQAEPDYGLVAELQQQGPPAIGTAFGLAAEVSRRRGGKQASLTGARYGPGSALRPRKRLAATGVAAIGPPAEFLLDPTLAEKDPFDAADRMTGRDDPFVLADEQVKMPTLPFEPLPHQDQELVQGPVPLRVPPEGDETTMSVTGDGQYYGIAGELGADQAALLWQQQQQQEAYAAAADAEPSPTQRRRELEAALDFVPPTGPQYMYNQETGMLYTLDAGAGEQDAWQAREFVEDGATGRFYPLNNPGIWKRLAAVFGRVKPQEREEDDEAWFEEAPDTSFKGGLQASVTKVTNLLYTLGIFFQGLLCGFSLLVFLLNITIYGRASLEEYLAYFSPVAITFSRIFYSLTTLSTLAATARFAKDLLASFQPRGTGLRWVDSLQALVYFGTYILTVICTPIEYRMTYTVNKNALYFQLTMTQAFLNDIKVYRLLDSARCALSWVGWILVCYQHSPYLMEKTVKHEMRHYMAYVHRVKAEQKARMQQQQTSSFSQPPPSQSARRASPSRTGPSHTRSLSRAASVSTRATPARKVDAGPGNGLGPGPSAGTGGAAPAAAAAGAGGGVAGGGGGGTGAWLGVNYLAVKSKGQPLCAEHPRALRQDRNSLRGGSVQKKWCTLVGPHSLVF